MAQSLLVNTISCKDNYCLHSSASQRKFLQPPSTTGCCSNPGWSTRMNSAGTTSVHFYRSLCNKRTKQSRI